MMVNGYWGINITFDVIVKSELVYLNIQYLFFVIIFCTIVVNKFGNQHMRNPLQFQKFYIINPAINITFDFCNIIFKLSKVFLYLLISSMGNGKHMINLKLSILQKL